jgi:cell division protease FtsH
VTIIPRSNGAGGFTLFLPSEDRAESGLYSCKYLKSQLVVALGGRVAEQLAFGVDEVTTGASNDLQQVRSLARRMIAQWGFRARAPSGAASVLDSPVAWETPDGKGAMGAATCASQGTERLLDSETKQLVEDAFETCRSLLEENRPLLDAVVKNLVEFETIDATMLQNLVLEYSQMPQLTNNAAPAPAEVAV